MILWPRLPLPLARTTAARLIDGDLRDLEQAGWSLDPPALFAPTGGVRIDVAEVRRLRKDLIGLARRSGYPAPLRKNHITAYDQGIMECLADAPMSMGEGLRPETWAWLAVCLVPHLVRWRWPAREDNLRIDRFAGPLYRNSLGRLWYQARALDGGKDDPERWRLATALGADQQVALFERPSLAASPVVSRAVVHGWLRLPSTQRSEAVFRQTMKSLIVRAGIQRLDLLPTDDLNRTMDAEFAESARRINVRN